MKKQEEDEEQLEEVEDAEDREIAREPTTEVNAEDPGDFSEDSSAPEVVAVLSHREACECLHTLGKIDSGCGYAYLGLNASNRSLTDISVTSTFEHVIFVNVSGNQLTSTESIRPLTRMTYLLMLQADRCGLLSATLNPMPHLQVLTLNGNRLTDTLGIEHPMLERLELRNNGISAADLNPRALENLKFLDLGGNLLESTSGCRCTSLTHVYLAGNKIRRIEGLETLVNLRVLHLRRNRISSLDGFTSGCANLKYLNFRENLIDRISEFRKLDCLPRLEVLVVKQNPATGLDEFQGEEEEEEEKKDTAYRRNILTMLINLKRIDKDPVFEQERTEARKSLNRITRGDVGFDEFDFNPRDQDEDF